MYSLPCFSEECVLIKTHCESTQSRAQTVYITSKAVTTFPRATNEELNCKLTAEFFSEWWYQESAGVADGEQLWRVVL